MVRVIALEIVHVQRAERVVDEALKELMHQVDVEFADARAHEIDFERESRAPGEIDDELWDNVLAVNLTAPMRLCRRLLPLMSWRGGSIVNVSSAAGLGGSGAGAAYHASKHGLIGLTKHIAFTYGPQGIRCNAICPGGVETGIGATATPTVQWAFERQLLGIALGERTAPPDEIATALSWLASDEASNVNGVVLPVDGGWKAD